MPAKAGIQCSYDEDGALDRRDWIPALAFFGWIVVTWWATVRAIKQQT